MSKPFDMELFLNGVLVGSKATRQRHLRQAKTIHQAISKRWGRISPWTWRKKHMEWFLMQYLKNCTDPTSYYYGLTARLIAQRLGKRWFVTRRKTQTKGNGK